MILESSKTNLFPNEAYIVVNNKPINADVWINFPIIDTFSFEKECVAVFYINTKCGRKYILARHFTKFSNDSLIDLSFNGYLPNGFFLFFNDLDFLKDFENSNLNYIF